MLKVSILQSMRKVNGGLLLVPMVIMAVLHTFLPSLFMIGAPTQVLFSSEAVMALVGLMLFFSGTQVCIAKTKELLQRYGMLCTLKVFFAFLFGWLYLQFFGYDGFMHISAIAFVAVMTSTNPGLFLALLQSDKDACDDAAFGLLNLIVVPVIPMSILNIVQGQAIDYVSILSTMFPFILGVVLRYLDDDFGDFFAHGTTMLLPFLGISFGARIDLIQALQAGLQGVLITIMFYVFSFVPLYVYAKKQKLGEKRALAMSSVAGLSLVVPVLMSQMHPETSQYLDQALSQIAFAVILTSFITPYFYNRLKNKTI